MSAAIITLKLGKFGGIARISNTALTNASSFLKLRESRTYLAATLYATSRTVVACSRNI